MRIVAADVYFPERIEKSNSSKNLIYDCARPKGDKDSLIMDMCLPVCKNLLQKAGIRAEEIDMILSLSVTPDRLVNSPEVGAPRLCHPLQRELNAKNAFVFDLLDADWGSAIEIAKGFALDQGYKFILIVKAELTFPSILPDPNTGFSLPDGIGVLLLSPTEGTRKISYSNPENTGNSKMELLEANELCKNEYKSKLLFNIDNAQLSSINQETHKAIRESNCSKSIAESWFPGHNDSVEHSSIEIYSSNNKKEFKHLGPFTLPFFAKKLLEEKISHTDHEILSISFNPFLLQTSYQNLIL